MPEDEEIGFGQPGTRAFLDTQDDAVRGIDAGFGCFPLVECRVVLDALDRQAAACWINWKSKTISLTTVISL